MHANASDMVGWLTPLRHFHRPRMTAEIQALKALITAIETTAAWRAALH